MPIQYEKGCSAPVNKLISTSIVGKIPKIVEYKCYKKCKLQVLYYINNGTRGYLDKEDTMKYKEFKIFLYASSTYIFSKYQVYNMFQKFPQFNGTYHVLTTYLPRTYLCTFFSAKKYAEHKFEDTFVDEEQAVFEIDGWKYWYFFIMPNIT